MYAIAQSLALLLAQVFNANYSRKVPSLSFLFDGLQVGDSAAMEYEVVVIRRAKKHDTPRVNVAVTATPEMEYV